MSRFRRDSIPKKPDDRLHAEVKRLSRFTYSVAINDPTGHTWGNYWYVTGTRARAEAFAERKLKKALRLRGYEREATVIFREQ